MQRYDFLYVYMQSKFGRDLSLTNVKDVVNHPCHIEIKAKTSDSLGQR